ncbi:Protein of unknown function [Amycolatopsis australiensis]|uniref:DUF998 domain-containing protein n=1 Tax=Amycolatopsis australiensis TaxID=546364 RepID=A0A1K1PNB2_9PSEU|nr:Protein of unknown function [Amycolatopsis australiensis]
MGTGQGTRTRPWRLVALGAIGWGLFTAVVLHIISSRDPVYDTLSSYTVTDRGEGMLAASVLSLAIGSLAVLGALHVAGVPLSRTTRILLTLWSLGLAAAAVFPASYPEAPDPVSGEIHLYACLVAFCSLPGAAISLLEPLRDRPERVALVRAIRLTAGAFALFATSFVFVRLSEAGVEPFRAVSDAFPIGVMQRVLLLADVVLLCTLLGIATRLESAFDGRRELGRVAVETGHAAGVQEHHVLVRGEAAVVRPLDQRGGHLAGVDRIEHDTLPAPEEA